MPLIKKLANSKIGRTALLLGLFGLEGCFAGDYRYEKSYVIPVDQLFKNPQNFEIIYFDETKKMQTEKVSNKCQGVSDKTSVFKSLKKGERGYAKITIFRSIGPIDEGYTCSIGEIHLPEDYKF